MARSSAAPGGGAVTTPWAHRRGRQRARRTVLALALAAAAAGLGSTAAAVGAAGGGPEKRWSRWWRQADDPGPADGTEGEHFAQLPLPLALITGVSLVLLWETVQPRTSPLRSSIARQVGRAFGAAQPEGGLRRRVTRHTPAATALKEKMSEISYWAPPRCLTRASSAFVPRRLPDALALPAGSSPSRAGSKRLSAAQAGDDWLRVEEGSGPLGLRPPERGCVVFFAQHTVVAKAGSKDVALTLFRAGDLSHELSVSWSTMDGTASAGVDYETCTGTTHFAPGAAVAELRVRLLPEELFFTQRFFVVHVESLGGRATMGTLPFARVRLLDAGTWPPGLQPERLAAAPLAYGSWARLRWAQRLVVAFVKMLVRFRGRKYWTVVGATLWKDFHQVVLNALLLNFALYDLCLTRAEDPAAYRRLPVVVCLKLVLVLFDRVADHFIATLTGAGPCSRLVQMQVLHKYLEMRHDPVDLGRFYHLFHDTAPECVAFAYKPTFTMIHSTFTLALSFLMALAVPMLRGHPVSLKTLRPLFGIVALVPLAFLLALPARRADFEALVQKRRESHVEVCGALQEVLACRHGVRAFDGAYPAQQVRMTFDFAYSSYGGKNNAYFEFKDDTHWVAKYLGELAKLVALLYGGYEVLNHARTGAGTMTLGQFAVVIGLYGSIIGAFYDFIEAWDGFSYARILLTELSGFFGQPDPWCTSPAPTEPADVLREWLSVKFDSVHLDIELEDTGAFPRQFSDPLTADARGVTAEIPLGCIYAVTASEGWSCARRYVGALLGGATSACRGSVEVPSFVRSLMVSPPASLAAGSVLDNLLSYAATWVRGSDALAVVAALGAPFEAPSGVEPLHDLRPGRLLEALGTSVGASAEAAREVAGRPRLRRLPAAEKADEELLAKAGSAFRARMAAAGVTVLSPMSKVEPLLRPHELQLLDLARGLLADPDALVVQDTLSTLPAFHARSALRFMQAWQRLGGLRGVVLSWERLRLSEAQLSVPPSDRSLLGGYPAWLTEAGGLCRTLVLSESALVTAGLELRSRVDAWLVVGSDRLEVTAADGEAAGASAR